MELNLEVCKAIAVQHGMPLQFVVKEFHVFDVLGQISASAGARLVFKGGTALNKIYLKKGQRFSEDLDFDLDVKTNGELRAFCNGLSKEITGHRIGELRKVKDTYQFDCAYEPPFGGADHIRVDVSRKKVVSALPLQVKPATSDFAHLSVSGFTAYSLEDLVARKMHALCTRTEGKDVFDVHSALPLCGNLLKPILCMLKAEGEQEDTRSFVQKTIEAVEKSDPKKLASLTNPFIPLAYRPKDWRELKNDLILKLESLKV